MNLNINILVLLNFHNVCMNWTRTSYVTKYFWNMQLHLGACLYVYACRQWSPYKLGSLAAFSVSYVWPILFWKEMDLQLMCKPSKRKCLFTNSWLCWRWLLWLQERLCMLHCCPCVSALHAVHLIKDCCKVFSIPWIFVFFFFLHRTLSQGWHVLWSTSYTYRTKTYLDVA